MANEFENDIQSLAPGEEVQLFEIDLNPLGVNLFYHFTPSTPNGESLVFGGLTYTPYAIEAKGFERATGEELPSPTLVIGNVAGASALARQNDYFIGAKITRIKTYAKYLDVKPNGDPNPDANSSAHFLPDIYYVNQKKNENPQSIEWELKSVLSLEGQQIPRRRCLKSVCERIYRAYDSDAAAFVYADSEVACPYSDSNYFEQDGTVTVDPTLDVCNKDLPACLLRFPDGDLPGWFFPGVRRTRI